MREEQRRSFGSRQSLRPRNKVTAVNTGRETQRARQNRGSSTRTRDPFLARNRAPTARHGRGGGSGGREGRNRAEADTWAAWTSSSSLAGGGAWSFRSLWWWPKPRNLRNGDFIPPLPEAEQPPGPESRAPIGERHQERGWGKGRRGRRGLAWLSSSLLLSGFGILGTKNGGGGENSQSSETGTSRRRDEPLMAWSFPERCILV